MYGYGGVTTRVRPVPYECPFGLPVWIEGQAATTRAAARDCAAPLTASLGLRLPLPAGRLSPRLSLYLSELFRTFGLYVPPSVSPSSQK